MLGWGVWKGKIERGSLGREDENHWFLWLRLQEALRETLAAYWNQNYDSLVTSKADDTIACVNYDLEHVYWSAAIWRTRTENESCWSWIREGFCSNINDGGYKEMDPVFKGQILSKSQMYSGRFLWLHSIHHLFPPCLFPEVIGWEGNIRIIIQRFLVILIASETTRCGWACFNWELLINVLWEDKLNYHLCVCVSVCDCYLVLLTGTCIHRLSYPFSFLLIKQIPPGTERF